MDKEIIKSLIRLQNDLIKEAVLNDVDEETVKKLKDDLKALEGMLNDSN